MQHSWYNSTLFYQQDKYKVTLDYDESAATIIKTLSLGSSNTYDLYFTMLNTNQYNKDFENLDDVLDYTVSGESKNTREKEENFVRNAGNIQRGIYAV